MKFKYEVMEAHCNAAVVEYFAARPQLDSSDARILFEAGFCRAWKAALSYTHPDGRPVAAEPFVQA